MQIIHLDDTNEFTPGQMKRFFLVENSPNFKIINFNLDAGVTFPVHSHDLDGELSGSWSLMERRLLPWRK